MKKLILMVLFLVGLGMAITFYQGLANKGEYQSLIIDFRDDISNTAIAQDIESIKQKYQTTVTLNSAFSTADHIYVLKGDQKVLKELQKTLKEDTEYVEPNYIYQALESPNDPDYSRQWNLQSINIESAWQDSKGEGVTVAVIDTGVTQVPDLQQTEIVEGYDFVNDRSEAVDDQGHGTHVAGTIAQSTNNNYGVAGIAYKAKIMPIKVLSAEGGGTISDIAEGIRFAVDHQANVINMSLGGGGDARLMRESIEYAYNKGVTIVAAAGNSNQNSAGYPARYPQVISVSALDSNGNKADYSNFGAGVDISAPGGGEGAKILQETIDPSTGNPVFVEFQGTSMASPHVAGVVALIESVGIKEPEQIKAILQQSSLKVKDDPLNHFGAGKLNAGNAVALAKKGQISFKDFFKWLQANGYLNLKFWIDGGAVALIPKILMVVGSYLLAWFLRNYFPFQWTWSFNNGLILGSSGLFFLRGVYIFDLPQAPFRVLGSSIAELGNVIQGTPAVNPIFASIFIPFLLLAFLSGNPQGKWFSIAVTVGMSVSLGVMTFTSPLVWGIDNPLWARVFLGVNSLLCFALAQLMIKGENTVSIN